MPLKIHYQPRALWFNVTVLVVINLLIEHALFVELQNRENFITKFERKITYN